MYVHWSMPDMIHTANMYARKNPHGCLLFMDDLHIISPDVQSMFFELVLERSLGGFKLDKNVAMLAAMNNSNMAGFDGFFSAINNRIQRINVNLPWLYWYKNCGAELNPYIAGFLRNFTSFVEEPESTEEPFATYRSWTILSKLLEPIVQQYRTNKDNTWFTDQIYMHAKSFMGRQAALALKTNVSQQLEYDYENMVKTNTYHVDKNNPISHFSFGNIIRYLRDEKDVENLALYVKKLMEEDKAIDDYSNVVLNLMYELLAFTNMKQKNKNEEHENRLKLCRMLQSKMFDYGGSKVHKIIRNLVNNPKF